MVGCFRNSEPVDLATERSAMAEVGAPYRAMPGVLDEPATSLLPGSYLMTPEQHREDVVIQLIHGGGFRSRNAAVSRPGSPTASTPSTTPRRRQPRDDVVLRAFDAIGPNTVRSSNGFPATQPRPCA